MAATCSAVMSPIPCPSVVPGILHLLKGEPVTHNQLSDGWAAIHKTGQHFSTPVPHPEDAVALKLRDIVETY